MQRLIATVIAISPVKDHIIDELKIRHVQRLEFETVLVLQGGGSLGAYECGVFKALDKQGIRFDVVAGTSIGAINAGIIAGSKSGNPASDLEAFWLDVAERVTPFPVAEMPRAIAASMYSAAFGNSRVFMPSWHLPGELTSFYNSPYFPLGFQKPYLYELAPLKRTLSKYIDFQKFGKADSPRLIVTCTDLMTSQPVIFDSQETKIDEDHLTACASFPFYGISWTLKENKYLWDGALLSNTPLREVIDASPRKDKKVYIVNLFPSKQDTLPQNMLDSWHRARDIMHTDRTDQTVRMSKVISKYLLLMKEMHDIISNVEMDESTKARFLKIEKEYHKLASHRGAIIEDIVRIERSEDIHYLFEDADFSLASVKKLIEQGMADTEKVLKSREKKADLV